MINMQIHNWTNNEATKAGVSSFLSILRSSASFLAHAISFELSSFPIISEFSTRVTSLRIVLIKNL